MGLKREGVIRWNKKWLAVCLIVLTASAAAALFLGRYSVSVPQFLSALFSKDGSSDGNALRVVLRIRLPRICFCLAAGAGLAAAGAAFQGVCANPLATPDTVGVAGGASFGAALGIMLGMNGLRIQITAMLFGILAAALVFGLSRRLDGNAVLMLVLAGMAVGSLFSALLSLVKYIADPQDELPVITYWLLGSLNAVGWKSAAAGLPWIAAGTAVLWLLRWRLNALSLSEEEARALGASPALVRAMAVGAASMITAAVVAACGQIGWVGLLIPHGSRLLFGGDYRQILPSSACFGALFLLIADTAARSAAAAEIPVAILTALIGAPAFLILLRARGGPER